MTVSVKTRVLYLGAGAPHAAASGMDMVARVHIDELLGSAYLDVTGLVVASAVDGRHDTGGRAAIAGVSILVGDPVAGVSRARLLLRKLIYAVTGCGAMIAFSFRSAEARRLIGRALRSRDYDIVVIDHFATLANIPIQLLRISRIPIVYIAHDVMPVQIRDTGRLHPRRWPTGLLFGLEGMKASFYERMLLKRSRTVIFLSSYDRDSCGAQFLHAETLLPISPRAERPAAMRVTDRLLLFVGSPRFRPNEFAINWLVDEFAPLLHSSAPSFRILLAGAGTERVQPKSANLVGLGFVPDDDLARLTDSAGGLICPIVHGSGIKIKVLEAIARGCPVFATEQALRGLEEFEIKPVLDVNDPSGSVRRIVDLVNNQERTREDRARIIARYSDYSRKREGRLACIVRDLAEQCRQHGPEAPQIAIDPTDVAEA